MKKEQTINLIFKKDYCCIRRNFIFSDDNKIKRVDSFNYFLFYSFFSIPLNCKNAVMKRGIK